MKQQLTEMLRLAGPVILAELGWMFMGVVDTIMVGSLGPTAIGAVSVGHVFWISSRSSALDCYWDSIHWFRNPMARAT